MQDSPHAELQLQSIFEKYSCHQERIQAAMTAFAIRPGSMHSTVFRLWFEERHRELERSRTRSPGQHSVSR